MKRLYWKRALKLLSLLLAIVLCFLFLQDYVFRDYWQKGQASLRLQGFYREPKDSLDVVLIGDSTFYAGYSAAYAYETQGITSYNIAIGSNVCVTWRPLTEEILRRQDPDLIVIEIGSSTYGDLQQKYETTPAIHILLDNMPMSANRIRTIQREIVGRYHDDPLEYYLPLIRYHSDWSSFGELAERAAEMFSWKYISRNVLKGEVGRVEMRAVPEDQIDVRQDTTTEPISEDSEAVLRDYLAYCRENDINVLFVNSPTRVREEDPTQHAFRRANYAGQIVREYGFDFVSFSGLVDEIGLDFETDYYNDEHMNYHGQQKYTQFLSRFFVEEYGVGTREQTESNRAAWDRSADYIRRFYAYLDSLPDTDKQLYMENIETMKILDAMGPAEGSAGE